MASSRARPVEDPKVGEQASSSPPSTDNKPKACRLFISFAAQDEQFAIAFEKHLASLKRRGMVDVWHRGKLTAGASSRDETQRCLAQADIVVLLVSASFLDSDDCWDEEALPAMERQRRGLCRVLPVIVSPADWKTSALGGVEVFPSRGRAVVTWPSQDEAWRDVTQAVQGAIYRMTPTTAPGRQQSSLFLVIRTRGTPHEVHCSFAEEAELGRDPSCRFAFLRAPRTVRRHEGQLFYRNDADEFAFRPIDRDDSSRVRTLVSGAEVVLGGVLRFSVSAYPDALALLLLDDDGSELARYVLAPRRYVAVGSSIAAPLRLPGVVGFDGDVTFDGEAIRIYYSTGEMRIEPGQTRTLSSGNRELEIEASIR